MNGAIPANKPQETTTYWFEQVAPTKLLGDIPVDHILFETDFPHPTCLFPEPLRSTAPTFKNVDLSLRRKVFSENAAHVYNIDLSTL